ncbi:uncharacterized protein LOC117112300 [Anneissia japonica]|uniref:uncharacterized protein LOC117112300 n=1 Tax=Anneissia japonica TaxID=1529436 RepID=UPI001425B990|nr:uncharacterized protein LOC117112300 [Anneissia japonica]
MKRRKRGRRGGVRQRLKRRTFNPPLPSIIMFNARSIREKLEELTVNTTTLREFRDACLICVTETWFRSDVDTHSFSHIDGFTCLRADRTPDACKDGGGGVCIYINNRWCSNIKVFRQYCTKDIELLTVALRPYYLPREFPKIFVMVVYITTTALVENLADYLQDLIRDMENDSPDAVKILTGDFNQCDLKSTIPLYHQYVDKPTRGNNILDKCYGNLPAAYKCVIKPKIGTSDHDVVHLLPQYVQRIKAIKPTIKSIRIWSRDSIETLRGCFEVTNWDVFFEGSTLNGATEAISHYIDFCVESVVQEKQIKVYPNNKPWLNGSIKKLFQRKYKCTDEMNRKEIQKEIKHEVSRCKRKYGQKVEEKFKSGNTKQVWKCMQMMTGYDQKCGRWSLLYLIVLYSPPRDVVAESLKSATAETVDYVHWLDGDCILHHIALGYAQEMRKSLMISARNVNLQDKVWQETPLHKLLKTKHIRDHLDIARLLLDAGADVNIENKDNQTPRDLYIQNECEEYDSTNREKHKEEVLQLLQVKLIVHHRCLLVHLFVTKKKQQGTAQTKMRQDTPKVNF